MAFNPNFASSQDIKPVLPTASTSSYHFPQDDEEEFVIPDPVSKNTWAVKIPRFLLERWETVQEADVELGTLVIDTTYDPPIVSMKLPSSTPTPSPISTPTVKGESLPESSRRKARYDTSNIPDQFEFSMPPEQAKNTFVFVENERSWSDLGGGDSGVVVKGEAGSSNGVTYGKRKREKAHPRLVSAVAHECTVRPVQSEKYNRILQQRRLESEQSKRPLIQLDSSNTTQGKLNQLASGYSNATSSFGQNMLGGKSKSAPGERNARLERNELVDRLFALFSEKPYWGIPALKQNLHQPDQYLREILKEVAVMKKEGIYANMWELKDQWKKAADGGVKGEASGSGVKREHGDDDMDGLDGVEDGDDDDEDFDEADFEEIVG